MPDGTGYLPGERRQAILTSAPPEATAIFQGPQIVRVVEVDYGRARVEVFNSNGPRWARVLKAKSSDTLAGEIDMPNVGDVGVVIPVNGDPKSPVWIGALNGIEPSRTLEMDENFVSKADLVHRAYRKHETGTQWILSRLGDFVARFKKKASQETDPAKKNVEVSFSKDGVLTVTHFRGDDKTGFTLQADQAGLLALILYKADGSTQAFRLQAQESGDVAETVANDRSGTVSGKKTDTITGDWEANTGGLAKINGGQELAFKVALETLKAQHDVLATFVIAHVHPVSNAVPAAPGPVVAAPSVPPFTPPTPITPTGTVKTRAG